MIAQSQPAVAPTGSPTSGTFPIKETFPVTDPKDLNHP